MKSTFKPRSLTRSIMALFGTKKGVNPHIRYPDAYYRRVYFDKQMFNGIELVAKIENKDTKVAEHDLMEQALTEYMAKQTRLQVRRELIRIRQQIKQGDESELAVWVIPSVLACSQRPLRDHPQFGGRNIIQARLFTITTGKLMFIKPDVLIIRIF